MVRISALSACSRLTPSALTLRLLAALAVDMTARNVQDELKAKRLPWTIAKGFDTFTPIRYDLPARRGLV